MASDDRVRTSGWRREPMSASEEWEKVIAKFRSMSKEEQLAFAKRFEKPLTPEERQAMAFNRVFDPGGRLFKIASGMTASWLDDSATDEDWAIVCDALGLDRVTVAEVEEIWRVAQEGTDELA